MTAAKTVITGKYYKCILSDSKAFDLVYYSAYIGVHSSNSSKITYEVRTQVFCHLFSKINTVRMLLLLWNRVKRAVLVQVSVFLRMVINPRRMWSSIAGSKVKWLLSGIFIDKF